MTYEEVEEIKTAFESKAPSESFMYRYKPMDVKNEFATVTLCGFSLFDGPEDNSLVVASIQVKGIKETNIFSVTLHIGKNEYQFIENAPLCKELIERFVSVPLKQISKS